MRQLLKRNEELKLTLIVYGLLFVVLLSFLSVRWTKATYARMEAGPSVLTLYPSSVVPGAAQRVTVLSEGTHFGPPTTVRCYSPGVTVSDIRFVSEREMSFVVYPHVRGDRGEGSVLPLEIHSPREKRTSEEIPIDLTLTYTGDPVKLDLFNFPAEDTVTVEQDYVMFGYRPRGYAPFHLKVLCLDSGTIREQRTDAEIEHLGVRLHQRESRFSLTLSDALGREDTKDVTVLSNAFVESGLLATLGLNVCHASGPYTGNPTQWGSDPAAQMAASDCVLGNGPLGCSGGCGSGARTADVTVRPPPNDYITTLGQAEEGGEGVLLHNGQYREDVVDLYIPGRGLDFIWKRSYQSGINLDGYLGKNWDFSWGAHFAVEYSGPTPIRGRFSRGDGRRDLYDGGAWVQFDEFAYSTKPPGYFDIKTAVYTSSSEVRQIKRNGFKQIFDLTTGRLKSREDRYGNKLSVIYDISGKLSQVQDTLSRTISFSYYSTGIAQGRLSKVTDFASRALTYQYAEAYFGGPIVLSRVLYPPTDWLADTTDPWTSQTNTSRVVGYYYDSTNARLTVSIDGRGYTKSENIYDANGRVDYQRNYSSGTICHDFTWTLASGKVSQASWKNRSTNEKILYFDTTNHLSTRIDVLYTSEGTAKTATTLITRGCTCTLPTAIQEPPDNAYTTFTISSDGDVTEKRQYLDDTSPYTTTAGSDLVRKAYFAPVNSSQFGVATKIVGPKAFTATPNEAAYAINITYDLSGNPTSITYPDTTNPTQTGHTETRTYNSNGQLLTVARPEGLLTTLTYYNGTSDLPLNNKGYLKDVKVKWRTTTPNELMTTYKYSAYGARTSVTDPSGLETVYTIDNEFLVKQVTTPAPFSYIRKYSYNGNRAQVKKEVENRKGTGARDSANEWWETQYIFNIGSALATQKREISQSGATVTWQEQSFAFDNDFRTTLATDGRGKSTLFVLDERGLQMTIQRACAVPASPDESETCRVFDDERRLVKTVRPFQNPGEAVKYVVSRIEYDVFDRPTKIHDGDVGGDPDNYTQKFYDLASMVTKEERYAPDGPDTGTDPDLLRRWETSFDELDRRWRSIRYLVDTLGTVSGDDTTTFEHDGANRVTKATDDNGNVTRTEYDLASRTTKTIQPSIGGGSSGENYQTIEYDLNSNTTKRTSHEVESFSPYNSADFVWEMAYDELNRVTTTTFKGSDGATGPNPVDTINTYDTRNLVIKVTDVDGVPTEHEYDGLMRRTKTTYNIGGTNPSPIVVTAAFDLASNMTSQTDADNKTTTYGFDDQNRQTLTTHPDGDRITYGYNDLGILMSVVYGNGMTDHKTINYRYTDRGLLTKREVAWAVTPTWSGYDDYKTTEETFGFDGAHRLTKGDDNDTRVTFVYNSLDQVTEEKLEINLRSGGVDSWKSPKTTTSAWDQTGRRRASVAYPISGKVFENAHDALNRITEMRFDGSPDKTMAKYWYEGPGLEVAKRERGVNIGGTPTNTFRTVFTDDPLGRNTQILHERDTGTVATLRKLDYTWGNGTSGRLYQRSSYDISDASTFLKQDDYSYDKVGRIQEDLQTVGTNPVVDYDFTVDSVQFWSEMKKGGAAQKTMVKATDGSHQMTSYTEVPSSSVNCSYDVCGNRTTDGTLNYYYDHNNRLAHIDGGTDLWYRYDVFGRMVVEKVGSPTTTTLFYYDGLHIIEETDSSLALTRLSLFGIGLDEVLYSGTVDGSGNLTNHRWPLTDHLGSVLVVVDDSAVVKTTFDYKTAFGEATASGTESYPYGYTGRRTIGWEVMLYDYRARTYDPRNGRFLQRDPIGSWGDVASLGNGHTYVGNDPVGAVDPSGTGKVTAVFPCELVKAERTGGAWNLPGPHPEQRGNLEYGCTCRYRRACKWWLGWWQETRCPERVDFSPSDIFDGYEGFNPEINSDQDCAPICIKLAPLQTCSTWRPTLREVAVVGVVVVVIIVVRHPGAAIGAGRWVAGRLAGQGARWLGGAGAGAAAGGTAGGSESSPPSSAPSEPPPEDISGLLPPVPQDNELVLYN